MRNDLTTVDSLPHKCVMIGLVESVPRQLLREKPCYPGLTHDLRQLPVVSKDIGIPELRTRDSKFLLKVSLTNLPIGSFNFGTYDKEVESNGKGKLVVSFA